MNYIKELNAFYDRQETNPLSSAAANLWHTLMHVNNRTGWKKEFTVSMLLLCCKAALTNSTFKRARRELLEKGYIHYESQGGNRAAKYQIVSSLRSTMDNMDVDTSVHESKTSQTLDHNVAPLLKQKETKQKITTAADDAIAFFQHNIGLISPYITNDLLNWVKDVGEPLVIAAMKRALERGKGNWGYIKGILQDWLKKGFTSVANTEGEEMEFKNKRKKRYNTTYESKTDEVIPDWFIKHKIKQETKHRNKEVDARESAELKALIAEYS